MIKVARIVACVLGIGVSSMICAGIDLSSMDFNYDLYSVTGLKSQQPLEVFSGDGKTYIKFPSTVTYKNKPELFIAKDKFGNTPKYHWQKPYIVIDGIVDYMKLVNSSNGKTLFNVQRVNQAYIPVTPSPYVTNETMDGFLINIGVGIGSVGSSSMDNAAANLAIGWDWALSPKVSRHWLVGFEIGGAFGGKSNGTGVTNSNGNVTPPGYDPEVSSFDADLLIRFSYLFFSGVYLTGKFGGAYLYQQVDSSSSNGVITNSTNNSSFAPEVALEGGYMMSSGLNFGLKYNYLFGLDNTVNNGVLSANLGIHF